MYEEYFGLGNLPFELTADPKYLFLGAKQREALSTLQYGLFSAKSITALFGEAGTGKTTLIKAALASERCRNVRCVYLDNPVFEADDLVRMLALKLDIGNDVAASKPVLLTRLEAVLTDRRSQGQITALVVDEAQSLSDALLEEIRLLANIETSEGKLLPLVLAGQPELAQRLESHELRQLKQRIVLRCELVPFGLPETASYIAKRLEVAGGVATQLFTQRAVTLIHEYSGGLPRTINTICDNALLAAMALGRPRVDETIIVEVSRDLKLKQRAGVLPAIRAFRRRNEGATAAPTWSSVQVRSGLSLWRRWCRFVGQLATSRR
jgi:general secretion pathway protein A